MASKDKRFDSLRFTPDVILAPVTRGDLLAALDAAALSFLHMGDKAETKAEPDLAAVFRGTSCALQDARFELESRMDAESRTRNPSQSVVAAYGDSPAIRTGQPLPSEQLGDAE